MNRAVSPTPILVSRRGWTWLVAGACVATLILLWRAPSVLTLAIGGVAFAIVMSFPVGRLSQAMPRSAAIAVSFLIVAGVLIALMVWLAPVLIEQLRVLTNAAPGMARRLAERVQPLLDAVAARGLLPVPQEEFVDNVQHKLLSIIQGSASRLLGQLGHMVGEALSITAALFGAIFVGIYLLADSRSIQAALLRASPKRYRRDLRELWRAFRLTLSRYLGGLALSLAIQGVLSAVALSFLGVPYATALGAWVAISALIPYIGAWIGAVPAVVVALSESPMTAVLTAVLFGIIQLLESNVLTPRIQARAVKIHPLIVFLGVIAAGEIAGLLGVVFAVPVLALLRVLFDFFRVRIRVSDGPVRASGVPSSRSSVTAGEAEYLVREPLDVLR